MLIISGHDLILRELQAFLSPQFEVRTQLVKRGVLELCGLSIPKNRVCIVDGNGPPNMVEAFVSTVITTNPNARVIVLLEELSDVISFSLLRAGVRGLMAYSLLRSQLHPALEMVAHGGYWIPRDLLARFVELVRRQRPARCVSNLLMSRREREVLTRLMENLSNKEIASQLNISERTVKFHVSNLLAKFGVQRRADLIVLMYQDNSQLHEPQGPSQLKTATADGA